MDITNFHDKMRVSVSNAELDLFIALQDANLTRGMVTQKRIILSEDKFTIPDYLWELKHAVVYLDGPRHLKLRSTIRDEEIDLLLEQLGYRIRRFPYVPPLSKTRKLEIVTEIRDFIDVAVATPKLIESILVCPT